MKLLTLAIAATLVASPAFADSTSSASLGSFSLRFFDLNPSDGVTPSITFQTLLSPPYYGSISHAALDPYNGRCCSDQYQENYSATPWDPVAASVSTSLAWATASLSGSTAFNPNNALLAAAGGSTARESPNPEDYVHYRAYAGSGSSLGLNSFGFTLSANTMVMLYAVATVSGSAQAGNNAYNHRDYAYASANIGISGPGSSGNGYQQSSDGIGMETVAYPGDGRRSFNDSKTLGASFVNLTGGDLSGYMSANADASGFSAAVVPEPDTYAMMLAGLGLLGFVARRRKQKLPA